MNFYYHSSGFSQATGTWVLAVGGTAAAIFLICLIIQLIPNETNQIALSRNTNTILKTSALVSIFVVGSATAVGYFYVEKEKQVWSDFVVSAQTEISNVYGVELTQGRTGVLVRSVAGSLIYNPDSGSADANFGRLLIGEKEDRIEILLVRRGGEYELLNSKTKKELPRK